MADEELRTLGADIAGALPNRRVGEDLCVSGGALLVVPRGQIVAKEP